jgi:hypothetical protein
VKRQGVQIRARKGYWALTAEETARATAPSRPGPPTAVQAALSSLTAASRGALVRTWVGTARGENGRTRVTLVWEPVAPPPGSPAARDGEDKPARLAVTAIAPTGEPYFRGKVPEARVMFDADPGQMQIKFNVEGDRGQVLDAAHREITVPDFTKIEVALSTPQLLRARTLKEASTLKADPTATPTTDREFRRTERLLLRLEAYAPGGAGPAVTAKLLNRGGQSMADVPVQPSSGAAGGPTHHIEIPLANLAPGEYLIEVTATADKGRAQELVAIRVIS